MSHHASLLFRSESDSLDFKRDQYPFEGADHAQKGELLKDILAMANSWREGTAYIVIGVDENSIPATVVGIQEHLEDASLQQFVNTKTQRPIKFHYRREVLNGLSVGVIEIPVQARPFYLNKDYGALKQHTVYLRRSSSTAIASPDEVKEMGASATILRQDDLQLRFARPGHRQTIEGPLAFSAKLLVVDGGAEVPDYTAPAPKGYIGHIHPTLRMERANPNFFRDIVERASCERFLRLASLTLTNGGSVAATNIRVEFTVPDPDGNWVFLEKHQLDTDVPYRTADIGRFLKLPVPVVNRHEEPTCDISRNGDSWHLTFGFGNLQPGRTLWPALDFYVGSRSTATLAMKGKIMADSLPAPLSCAMSFCATVVPERVTLKRLVEHFDRRQRDGEPPFDFSGLGT